MGSDFLPCAIVDGRISYECESTLIRYGYNVIKTQKNSKIGDALAYHPDMLMFSHKNRIITSVYYAEEAECLFSDLRYNSPSVSISFADEVQSAGYPKDAIYNALVVGNRLFCKTDSVSETVLNYARETGLDVIHVNQGYPACTVLPLSDRAAITADEGMARVLCASGIKVTLIQNGDISLPPHEYGFIGGAAGIHGGRVYFLGDISTHRDCRKIVTACRECGLDVISLGSGALADLGRIIFVD